MSVPQPAAATPQEHLEAIERLLGPHLEEGIAHRDNREEMRARLEDLHPADIAYILESLPLEGRRLLWELVLPDVRGEILLEIADTVRESLLAEMDSAEIVAATQELDADEIADLAPDLPEEVVQDIIEAQDVEDRAELQAALSYPEGTVGALMDFDVVNIREDATVEAALNQLRSFDELPGQTDALYVVDADGRLTGALPLKRLLVTSPEVSIATLQERDITAFAPEDDADEAAVSFDRYDLVSVPVIDSARRVIGRVTVDQVLDYVRAKQEAQQLGKVGLREEEDIFASVWASARNRGPWLALNLCTAFIASRVVGAFEGSIEKLAALAALMPIVAGIGGNSGNQTTTLIVRSLALGQVSASNARRLLGKELGISALNGVIWGGVLGFLTWLLYRNVALGGVMALAMLLNLVVAALAGIFIPLAMERFGRDPAMGSSVFLTAITDSMGFFIFLGLATLFLL